MKRDPFAIGRCGARRQSFLLADVNGVHGMNFPERYPFGTRVILVMFAGAMGRVEKELADDADRPIHDLFQVLNFPPWRAEMRDDLRRDRPASRLLTHWLPSQVDMDVIIRRAADLAIHGFAFTLI